MADLALIVFLGAAADLEVLVLPDPADSTPHRPALPPSSLTAVHQPFSRFPVDLPWEGCLGTGSLPSKC